MDVVALRAHHRSQQGEGQPTSIGAERAAHDFVQAG
jgi:hypothetical protein